VNHREAVGRRLMVMRQGLGITRNEWLKRYKLGASRYSMWESGLVYPDIKFLMQVCQDYGWTMDYFYRGSLAGVAFSRAQAELAEAAERSEATTAEVALPL
jgi:transcriptional regulator with XRE-family HTH domain